MFEVYPYAVGQSVLCHECQFVQWSVFYHQEYCVTLHAGTMMLNVVNEVTNYFSFPKLKRNLMMMMMMMMKKKKKKKKKLKK